METAKFIVEIIVVIVAVAALITNWTKQSQKREIKWQFEPASKAEFEKHVLHNTERHAQLFKHIEEARKDAAAATEKVGGEVESLGKDMARLVGINERQTRDIEIMNTDIKQILKRV